jgi:ABC-type phosphate transport system permease subunit
VYVCMTRARARKHTDGVFKIVCGFACVCVVLFLVHVHTHVKFNACETYEKQLINSFIDDLN